MGGVSYGNYQEIKREGVKEITFLFLLFYIDEVHKGRLMISEACQTRLKNIKRISWYDDKKYKAFSIPIQSVDEILEQTPKIIEKHSEGDTKRVIVAEIGVFLMQLVMVLFLIIRKLKFVLLQDGHIKWICVDGNR
jgi:hypothetical protein